MKHDLASSIYLIEKKYNKVFTDYEELASLLKKHLNINTTKEEIEHFEDNYYHQLEQEDRQLILKNILT